jgi:hypothetical protein
MGFFERMTGFSARQNSCATFLVSVLIVAAVLIGVSLQKLTSTEEGVGYDGAPPLFPPLLLPSAPPSSSSSGFSLINRFSPLVTKRSSRTHSCRTSNPPPPPPPPGAPPRRPRRPPPGGGGALQG